MSAQWAKTMLWWYEAADGDHALLAIVTRIAGYDYHRGPFTVPRREMARQLKMHPITVANKILLAQKRGMICIHPAGRGRKAKYTVCYAAPESNSAQAITLPEYAGEEYAANTESNSAQAIGVIAPALSLSQKVIADSLVGSSAIQTNTDVLTDSSSAKADEGEESRNDLDLGLPVEAPPHRGSGRKQKTGGTRKPSAAQELNARAGALLDAIRDIRGPLAKGGIAETKWRKANMAEAKDWIITSGLSNDDLLDLYRAECGKWKEPIIWLSKARESITTSHAKRHNAAGGFAIEADEVNSGFNIQTVAMSHA